MNPKPPVCTCGHSVWHTRDHGVSYDLDAMMTEAWMLACPRCERHLYYISCEVAILCLMSVYGDSKQGSQLLSYACDKLYPVFCDNYKQMERRRKKLEWAFIRRTCRELGKDSIHNLSRWDPVHRRVLETGLANLYTSQTWAQPPGSEVLCVPRLLPETMHLFIFWISDMYGEVWKRYTSKDIDAMSRDKPPPLI